MAVFAVEFAFLGLADPAHQRFFERRGLAGMAGQTGLRPDKAGFDGRARVLPAGDRALCLIGRRGALRRGALLKEFEQVVGLGQLRQAFDRFRLGGAEALGESLQRGEGLIVELGRTNGILRTSRLGHIGPNLLCKGAERRQCRIVAGGGLNLASLLRTLQRRLDARDS